MKPPVDVLRLSKQGRDQLIKVRRQTGVENWNVLCRWALCLSLREPTRPPTIKSGAEGGVEITWKVFAGEHPEIYSALVYTRASKDLPHDAGNEALAAYVRAHLHRGLAYLSSGTETKDIGNFLDRWLLPST